MSARLVIPSIDSSAAFLSSDGLLTSISLKQPGLVLFSGCFLTVVKLSSSGTDQMLRGQIPAMAAGIRSRCSQTQ